ncbi:MAG: Fur family transcriptional regulator [Bacteroidales bacterium]
MTTPEILLKEHHLSLTSCREDILSVLMKDAGTLSHKELTLRLKSRYNRTTLYRSLKVLEKNGIIRKITIDRRQVRYEIKESQRNIKTHAHFFCRRCGNLICLPDIPEFLVNFPNEVITEEADIILKGLCNECKSK